MSSIVKEISRFNKSSLNVIDVEEVTVESKCKSILCIVDKNNIDSMVGAALWISKLDFDKSIAVHSFHPLEREAPSGSYDQVVNFGCFIPERHLKSYMGKHHTKIFAYRNMYNDVKNSDRLEVIRPCDDWYGAEQALVDNSIAFNVNQRMHMDSNPSAIMALGSMVREVALYINYAQKGISGVKDLIKVHNLRVTLERVFSRADIRSSIRELRVINDPDGHRLRLDQVRQVSKLHGKERVFVVPGKGLGGIPKQYIVEMFSCPTGMSRDVMKAVLPVKGSCVTYESIGEYTMFRFVTESKLLSRYFAEQIKPVRIWEEGETIVAIAANK